MTIVDKENKTYKNVLQYTMSGRNCSKAEFIINKNNANNPVMPCAIRLREPI